MLFCEEQKSITLLECSCGTDPFGTSCLRMIEYQNLHDSPEKQAADCLNIDNINITFLISGIAEF